MNFRKKTNFIILTIIVVFICFGSIDAADATYHASGTLVSKNLLINYQEVVDSIDSFGYDATIPANTSLKVQFSQNKTSWYSSAGVQDAWDTLSDGDHLATGDAIDLSVLGWLGSYFFYKILFETTDSAETPVLSEIRVHFDEGTEETTYQTSGTLVSNNILDGEEIESIIDRFSYNASSIPSGASLRIQFSQDNSSWYNSAGTVDAWDTCLEGEHSIDLRALNWSSSNFYYKIEFSSDGSDTPILDEISLYASSVSIKIKGGIRFKGGIRIK